MSTSNAWTDCIGELVVYLIFVVVTLHYRIVWIVLTAYVCGYSLYCMVYVYYRCALCCLSWVNSSLSVWDTDVHVNVSEVYFGLCQLSAG